ncbi:2-phosphoxylose phosphatase 1 isoform X1 [Hemiscyllium ocellatum]|uniref:2-phosphoxylose phosphatase 1 isoform X1 n=2 Tax=Hemiscyllium ocellatum TaxID=170820 RepID=UPI002966A3E4|nr:2-phosphoxylose phosphatase 1 isoform X1 [Hemiscyllium ocellatum]
MQATPSALLTHTPETPKGRASWRSNHNGSLKMCVAMFYRNRFLFLLAIVVLLAVLSLSLQFSATTHNGNRIRPAGDRAGENTVEDPRWRAQRTPQGRNVAGAVHLIPMTRSKEDGMVAKSRKRILVNLYTAPPKLDPIYEAYQYCNMPNKTDRGLEGHAPSDYKLLSVHVMIRHGDRYPLYAIPKTKPPPIDCILIPTRKPSHRLLETFIKNRNIVTACKLDGPLNNIALLPSHTVCEMGELTQIGVVQHLLNGEHLHDTYIKKHKLLPDNWTTKHVYVESTGKSRTLQSGLALLYSLLPKLDWGKIHIRYQWSTIFCSNSCDCPMRNHYLEEEQRRQYNVRIKNSLLEQTYIDMAKIVGIPTRRLRAANPIDSLLCHFCHNISFPCTEYGCINLNHFKVIKAHQLEDDQDRQRKKLYYKYALLATHPILNQTVTRMQQIAQGKKDEMFALYSAHDVTVAPLLSALGIPDASFPRFGARIIFEMWQNGQVKRQHFIRILYNGIDVTFQTSFCSGHKAHSKQLLCPFENFLSFVRKDMFAIFNSTNYYDACHRRVF